MSNQANWRHQALERRENGTFTHGATGAIPQKIQKGIRERFRMMRLAKGKSSTDFACLKSGGINTYELHDISTIKLGTLYNLAGELGMAFPEYISYLIGTEDSGNATPVARNLTSMNVLMRALNEEEQEMLLNMIQPLVDHVLNGRRLRRPVDRDARKTAREILDEHAQ